MEASNNMNSAWMQRIAILVVVGALLVGAAYLWGNRLSASSNQSLSQAPQYATFRGVAAARAVDAAALRPAAQAESQFGSLRGVAAARAADAASASATGASFEGGLNGVAAVRAVDASQNR
jgi:hypothetical protein